MNTFSSPIRQGAAAALRNVPAFERADPDVLKSLADLADEIEVRPDERVFGVADATWILLQGKLRVVDPERESVIDVLHPGACFNDGALFDEPPARLALEGEVRSTVLRLPYDAITRYRKESPPFAALLEQQAIESDCRRFVESSQTLSVLSSESLQALLHALSRRHLAKGEFLIHEGEQADEVYFLAQGTLRVRARDRGATLALLGPGAVVGEIAVINHSRRTADVVAETDCSILVMPAGAFMELLSEQQSLAAALDCLVRERTGTEPNRTSAPTQENRSEAEEPIELSIAPWTDNVIDLPRRGLARIVGPGITLQQSEMDCGAACLGTICRYYGRRIDPNRLRRLANVTTSGSSMFDLKGAAESLGFETFAYRHNLRDLRANHLPAIINWRGYHWVVVRQIHNGRVTYIDPAHGTLKTSEEEFQKDWTGYVLYLRPTPRFAALPGSPSPAAKLLPLVRPYLGAVIQLGVAALSVQMLQLLIPLLSKFVIDDVVMRRESRRLLPAIIGVAGGSAASILLSLLRQRLLMFVSAAISLRLAQEFWDRLLEVPLAFFERRRTGDITSRLDEGNNIAHFLAGRGVEVIIEFIGALVYLALVFYLNWKLSTVAIAAMILYCVNLAFTSPRLRHGLRTHAERVMEATSHLLESLSGLRTIKLLGIERHTRWTYENLLARQANANAATIRYSIAAGLLNSAVSQLASVAVLFWGASMVLGGELSIGGLVAFTIVMGNLFAPVAALTSFWDEFQQVLISTERLSDVSENEAEVGFVRSEGLTELPRVQGHLRFSDVDFRYDPESRDVLQHINLEIRPGQTVGFVGRSGSGKSTLIKLLLGFCRPTKGAITIDGFDLDKVWLPSLRRQVGVVPQDTHFFRDTVRANLTLGAPDATLAEVVEAAKQAGAHDFISALPQGYDTVLEERGSNLSGGQRQRIALARSILQNPRLLILDEASSALDTESERFVFQNLQVQFRDRTVIMVAHRLSTVRNADLIVVLDRGVIIEQGSHDELMERRGMYFTLSTQRLQV